MCTGVCAVAAAVVCAVMCRASLFWQHHTAWRQLRSRAGSHADHESCQERAQLAADAGLASGPCHAKAEPDQDDLTQLHRAPSHQQRQHMAADGVRQQQGRAAHEQDVLQDLRTRHKLSEACVRTALVRLLHV
eukprot:354314-Chlamydomonas_euryale.AAC.3